MSFSTCCLRFFGFGCFRRDAFCVSFNVELRFLRERCVTLVGGNESDTSELFWAKRLSEPSELDELLMSGND